MDSSILISPFLSILPITMNWLLIISLETINDVGNKIYTLISSMVMIESCIHTCLVIKTESFGMDILSEQNKEMRQCSLSHFWLFHEN